MPLMEDVAGHAGARHAVGVADGDRPTGHVQAFIRNAEVVAAVEDLAGERLVQFPQADVVNAEPVLPQQLRNGEHGPDAHFSGAQPATAKPR